jgi:ComF family protein
MARVGRYRASLGRLVRAYKYRGREEVELMLAQWLCEAIRAAPWLDRVEGVVSVPTHWRHQLGRPLYAADALARLTARDLELPRLPILRRTRAGRHQVGLVASKRIENVRGAFALRPGVAMKDAKLLLIDDVRTTGATLEECAKVLRKGGASEVYAAVVAKVHWSDFVGRARPDV